MLFRSGGGGGGAKIICTELYRQGLMTSEIYLADQAFGKQLVAQSPETYLGYVAWASTVVDWMRQNNLWGKLVTRIAYFIATPWSKEMAFLMGVPVKRTFAGRILMKVGLRFCAAIGRSQSSRLNRGLV